MSASIETGAVVSEEKNNKCALKLIGLDFGMLKDEDILEFTSNYVKPSALKALFYDSFNSFYVLHLSDIESTCVLVGKTLQMSCYRVRFLPLFDSFVIGNVYMTVTNGDLINIFNVFGNVFEVTNHHVLPNSSKFFHVLSGTREITFLLPGDDTEVQIPITVAHPPFTFHVHKFCLGCLTQGHSILNCANKEDEDVENTSNTNSCASNHKDSLNDNSLIIKQEFYLSVSDDDTLKEKSSGVNAGKATATRSEELNSVSKKQEESPEIDVVVLEGSSSAEEEYTLPYVQRTSKKQPEIVLKSETIVNEEKIPDPKAAVRNVQESVDSRYFSQISPLLEKYILKVNGILLPHEMVELIQIDARNRRNVISFVSNITPEIKQVLSQLRKTLRKYLRDELFNTGEHKFKRKLLTLIKVLNDFKN